MSEDDDNAYNIGSLVVQMRGSGTPKEQPEELSSSKDNLDELSIDEIEPSFFMENTNVETPGISSMIEVEDGQTHFMKVYPKKPTEYSSSSQPMTVLPYPSACATPMAHSDYNQNLSDDAGMCEYSLPEEESSEQPTGASMLPTIIDPRFSARQSVSVLSTRNVSPDTSNVTNEQRAESIESFKPKMRQDSGFDESFKGSEKMEESFEEEFEEFPSMEQENEKLSPNLLSMVSQLKSNNVTQLLENYREQYPDTKNFLHAHMNRLSLLGAILSNEYADKNFPTSSTYNQGYEYPSTNSSVHSSNEVPNNQPLQNETINTINGDVNKEDSREILLRSHVNPNFKTFKYSERFSCTKCDYSSYNKSNFKNHLLIHSEERMFACPYCSYRGKQSAGLRAHLKVHSTDKPFTCSFCSYKCKRKQNLIQHLRIHSKHRPFHCDYCGYKCTTKQSLQKHMIRHFDKSHVNEGMPGSQPENELSGKRKFEVGNSQIRLEEQGKQENEDYSEVSLGPNDSVLKCLRCDFHTKRKCALKNHLKTHVGYDISCLFCSYSCESESQLILHLKSHQISDNDQCKSCNFIPILDSDFVTHFYHHKNPSEVVPLDIPPPSTKRINDHTTEVQSKPDKRSLQCPYCTSQFDTIICLKLHINNHSDQDFLEFERPKDSTDCHGSTKTNTDSHLDRKMSVNKTANAGNTLESVGKETTLEVRSEFPKERQYIENMTASNMNEKPSPLPHLTKFFKNGCPNNNNNNNINNNNHHDHQNFYKQMVEKASHNLNIKNRLKWRLQTLNQLRNNSSPQSFAANSIEKKPMIHNGAVKMPEDSVINCKEANVKGEQPSNNEDSLISEQVMSNSSGNINEEFIECSSDNDIDIEGVESTDEGNVSSHLLDSFDPIGVSTPHFSNTRFPNPSAQLGVASGSGELRMVNDKYINYNRNNRDFKDESCRESQVTINNDKTQDKNYDDERKDNSDPLSSSSAHCKDTNNNKSYSVPEENLIKDFDSKFSAYEFEDEISFDALSEKNYPSDLDEEYTENVNDLTSTRNETSAIPLSLIPKEVNKIMGENNETFDDKSESFQCAVCDAKFRRKSSLVNHKRSHAKEFFTCQKCPITFRYKRALIEHEKIHYIAKTYKCTECDFSSMRKCSLMSHYRSHRKKFCCMYCDFKCSLVKKMEKHYLKHKMDINYKYGVVTNS